LIKTKPIKTILITGAGRGLGKATAEAYHKAGFRVIATDFNEDLLKEQKGLDRYMVLKMNVASEEDVRQCAAELEKKVELIDIVVSNAGVFDFYPMSEAGADKLKKMFDVNVFGLANLTKYFLAFLERSAGRLIVISSESFKVPSPFQPYSVSKQALEKVYDSIKIELHTKGITSILIRPGAIQTKILDDTVSFSKKMENSRYVKEFDAFIGAVPKYINKIASPEDVAKTVFVAGTTRNPKPVYHVNHNPLVSLLTMLPARLKKYLVSRSLR
jgi:NAD(P)-dependent dehydrogenase (short-subunit alcohol dehydrogenase family)